MTIRYYVILSKAKDLKVFVTVTGPINCEILRFVQDDNPSHSSSLRGGWQSTAVKETIETIETKETRETRGTRETKEKKGTKRDKRGKREERDERNIRDEKDRKDEKEHTGNN